MKSIFVLALLSVILVFGAGEVYGDKFGIITVGPHLAECMGVTPQQCIMIKESDDTSWRLFYEQIDGFEYESGYSYMLKTFMTAIEHPPMDDSSFHHSLIEIMDKHPDAWAPLQQMNLRITPDNVICKEGLEFIFKDDGSPSCVTADTAEILRERGWAVA